MRGYRSPPLQSTPPREGGDCTLISPNKNSPLFNPRPPARGATKTDYFALLQRLTSIHAPPRGGRLIKQLCDLVPPELQSTPPREGGDEPCHLFRVVGGDFNPRPPARGATDYLRRNGCRGGLQSTPPREGGDLVTRQEQTVLIVFNPRPPARGATRPPCAKIKNKASSIHAPPRGGRLGVSVNWLLGIDSSIHAPPRGGRRCTYKSSCTSIGFNPRPPARGATAKMHSFTCGSLTNK